MRKLKLQMQISVDGFVAGPNGEMDWMVWNWRADIIDYVKNLTDPVSTIVLGRKLAEGFIPHWTNVLNDANTDEHNRTAARKFVETPKVVFSKTLTTSNWKHTTIANNLDEISKLKNQNDGDIIAYGGATFVADLIRHGLIDDMHLFVNPAAIGSGLSIFNTLDKTNRLKLVESKAFDCGIVVDHYQPNNRLK